MLLLKVSRLSLSKSFLHSPFPINPPELQVSIITTFVPGIALKADSNSSTLMNEFKKYVLSAGQIYAVLSG